MSGYLLQYSCNFLILITIIRYFYFEIANSDSEKHFKNSMLTKQIFNFYPDSISFTPTFSKISSLNLQIINTHDYNLLIILSY